MRLNYSPSTVKWISIIDYSTQLGSKALGNYQKYEIKNVSLLEYRVVKVNIKNNNVKIIDNYYSAFIEDYYGNFIRVLLKWIF